MPSECRTVLNGRLTANWLFDVTWSRLDWVSSCFINRLGWRPQLSDFSRSMSISYSNSLHLATACFVMTFLFCETLKVGCAGCRLLFLCIGCLLGVCTLFNRWFVWRVWPSADAYHHGHRSPWILRKNLMSVVNCLHALGAVPSDLWISTWCIAVSVFMLRQDGRFPWKTTKTQTLRSCSTLLL